MSTAEALVTNSVVNGVAQVRLARPDKLNALTLDTLDQLVATAHGLRRDRGLRAVVLAGEGDSFCAGLDFAAVTRQPVGVVKAFVPRPWRGTNTFQEACWAWRRLPVPVIAAVHGNCLGGGLQLALAADVRIATPDSRWSVLEGRWGLIPDMTGVRTLAELVGIDRAKLLTMTADVVTGEDAARYGLVTELDADPLAAAQRLALRLGERSPDAVAAAKRIFDATRTASRRRTFARERLEQAVLLAAANTKVARTAAFARTAHRPNTPAPADTPVYRPRVLR